MIRRTIGFIATVAVTGWGFYQLAWHPNVWDQLGGIGFFAVLLCFVAVAALLFWKVNRVTMVLAVILGAVGATVLDDVIKEITWKGVGIIAVALVVVFVLWILTCTDVNWFRGVRRWVLRLLSPPTVDADGDVSGPATLHSTGS